MLCVQDEGMIYKLTKVRRKPQVAKLYQRTRPIVHIEKYTSTPRWLRSCREHIVAECPNLPIPSLRPRLSSSPH